MKYTIDHNIDLKSYHPALPKSTTGPGVIYYEYNESLNLSGGFWREQTLC